MCIFLNKPVCPRECDLFPEWLRFCSWAPLWGWFSGTRPGLLQQQGVWVCFPDGDTGDRLQDVMEKTWMSTSGWIWSQIAKGLECQDVHTQDSQCPGVSLDVCSEMMMMMTTTMMMIYSVLDIVPSPLLRWTNCLYVPSTVLGIHCPLVSIHDFITVWRWPKTTSRAAWPSGV